MQAVKTAKTGPETLEAKEPIELQRALFIALKFCTRSLIAKLERLESEMSWDDVKTLVATLASLAPKIQEDYAAMQALIQALSTGESVSKEELDNLAAQLTATIGQLQNTESSFPPV